MTSELEGVFAEQNQNLTALNMDVGDEDKGTQFLSFDVGGEEFAVNILSVQEIRGWENPTFLPNSPFFIKGVLNLRGTIVPVMDLRTRFKFKKASYLDTTVIIILKVIESEKERLMGCVVDGVSDVFNMEESEISEVPEYGSGVDSRFTAGVMTVDDNAVTLLELSKLLSLDLIEHPYTGVSNG
ncbi:MAG: chemotaxis protein CheW [Kangiellaceae bacterium]|nr:chemotaxis protein CheW [Kangiellaceae bacterium]